MPPKTDYFAQLSPSQKAELFRIYARNGIYKYTDVIDHYNKEVDRMKSSTDKNFVRRLNDPEDYPYIDNKDGSISTHRMRTGYDDNDRNIMWPTIQQDNDGRLVDYGDTDDMGLENAAANNDTLQFNLPSLADYFGLNYKTHYPNVINNARAITSNNRIAEGGSLGNGGANIYDGETEDTQQMNVPNWTLRDKNGSMWSMGELQNIIDLGMSDPDWYFSKDNTDLRDQLSSVGLGEKITDSIWRSMSNEQKQKYSSYTPLDERKAAFEEISRPRVETVGRVLRDPMVRGGGAYASAASTALLLAPELLKDVALLSAENPVVTGKILAPLFGYSALDEAAKNYTEYDSWRDMVQSAPVPWDTDITVGEALDKGFTDPYMRNVADLGTDIITNPVFSIPYENVASAANNIGSAVSDGFSNYIPGVKKRLAESIIRIGDGAKNPRAVKKQLLNKNALNYILNPFADKSLAYRLPYRYSGNSVAYQASFGDVIDEALGKVKPYGRELPIEDVPQRLKDFISKNYYGRNVLVTDIGKAKGVKVLNSPQIGRVYSGSSAGITTAERPFGAIDPGNYFFTVESASGQGHPGTYRAWDIWKFLPQTYKRLNNVSSAEANSLIKKINSRGLEFLDSQITPIVRTWEGDFLDDLYNTSGGFANGGNLFYDGGDKPGIYVVKKGDTASQIANNNKISLARLKELNKHINLDKIQIGQKLYLSEPDQSRMSFRDRVAYQYDNELPRDIKYNGTYYNIEDIANTINKDTGEVYYNGPYYDVIKARHSGLNKAMKTAGFTQEEISRLTPFLIDQMILEGGYRVSRPDNNFGGVLDPVTSKKIKFKTEDDFYNYYLKNLDRYWGDDYLGKGKGWRNAKTLQEYTDIINREDLGLHTKDDFVAYNKAHRGNEAYIYTPWWENNDNGLMSDSKLGAIWPRAEAMYYLMLDREQQIDDFVRQEKMRTGQSYDTSLGGGAFFGGSGSHGGGTR